ncbi:MAG: ECF transporter S component [Nitrososphaerota archaeon]|nr:ECF transporter S component [Candidatus Bathyarchaeota archaeon]MDW8049059.1 ECF transporter S component [Nitrososphaerota archaeon]
MHEIESMREGQNQEKSVAVGEMYSSMSNALKLSLISINAALYAVAISVTSPIPTPWGVGHFRPGVVIPAFFSLVFGPLVGGLGAAIGCFIGDFALSFFGLTNPLLSLIAGVPGNFFGFYLLGWLITKNRSLSYFIIANLIALIVGNLIAALGVLAYFWFIVPDWAVWPLELKATVVSGLTIFWVTTMVIFVVPLVPILVAYIEPRLERIGVKGLYNLEWNESSCLLRSSGFVAAFLALIYFVVTFVPGGKNLFAGVVPPELILISAVIVLISGALFAVYAKKIVKPET